MIKESYEIRHWCQNHKTFFSVIYNPGSMTRVRTQGNTSFFMKLATGVNFIKLFTPLAVRPMSKLRQCTDSGINYAKRVF
jgi:hypothetical protein